MAKDVTTFLAWASEPELEERKRIGISVILFLLLLTILSYFAMRQIWAPIKNK
jgi:ubiquinol-cytochrome c reductase cytochrome c1 subunit